MAVMKTILLQLVAFLVMIIIVYKIYQFYFEEVTADETMTTLPILIIVYFVLSAVTTIMAKRDMKT